MTIKSLYPTVRPSLSLDFAKTKALDPRVTFTRASTGTFVGSNGLIQTAASGAARFDHNPTTGESLGLLVEEARTNLHVGSTTNALNAGIAGLTQGSASIVDPTGATSTVETWAVDTSTGNHSGYRFYNNTYVDNTYSLFVKSNGITRIQVSANQRDNSTYIDVDLISGSIISTSDNRATATKLANGWVRISSSAAADRAHGPGFWLLDSSGNRSFTGNGTSGVYVWGMQLEQASGALFPTSYIPTSGSTVTRAADVASMTGTNFSSWNNPTAGTFVSNFRAQSPATFSINGAGGSGDRLIFFEDAGIRIRQQLVTAGSLVYDSTPTTVYSKTASNKFAFALASGSQASALNGTVGGTGAATSIFTPTSMQIGRETAFGSYLNGSVARLAYYPVRLPDAQLQALTAT